MKRNTYKPTYNKFVLDMTTLTKKLQAEFAPYAELKIVTYHKAWEYFADAFDINIVTTIEPKPLITPSPAEMRKTIETMRSQNVKIVIVETYSSYDQAKSIADAVGAQLITLPDHVNGVAGTDSYQ